MIQKPKLIFFVSILIVILSLSAVVSADNVTDDSSEVKSNDNIPSVKNNPVVLLHPESLQVIHLVK